MPRASTLSPDIETKDLDSEPVDDTTEHNNQDLDEHEESSHDADSNPYFDEISNDNPEDELSPWVDYITHSERTYADDVKRNHVVDPQIETDLLEAGKDDCQTPRRPLDQACLQLEPSNVKHAKRVAESKEDWPRGGKMTSTYNYNQTDPTETINDLTSDMSWLTTAEDISTWECCGKSDFIQRAVLEQIAQPTTPITTTTTTQLNNAHDQTTSTTKAHDQNEDDTKDEEQDDDTPLILSQLIDS